MFESMDFASLLPTRQTTQEQLQEPEDDMCSLLPTLTWTERLIGCGTCMIAGYLLSFGSFFRVKELMFGNPLPFVLNATVGNIIALCGSCFLSGPHSQMKKMWAETRRNATICYLGSLSLTLILAFNGESFPGPTGLILLLLMICQYLSITWYCLSYVPYARETVLGFLQRRLSGLMGEE